jgi:hypothetical protein
MVRSHLCRGECVSAIDKVNFMYAAQVINELLSPSGQRK